MNPSGQLALVTGGASGIGRSAGTMLAARGARVLIADLDEAGGGQAVAAIEERGGEATFLPVDVADVAELEGAFAEIQERHGPPRIVINSAGIVSGPPDFPATPASRIASVLAINVAGTLVCTRLAIEAMGEAGGGAIVNVSSTLAIAEASPDPVYSASKAAVKVFTELSAPHALARGVRLNAVLPGSVDTPILAKTGHGRPADWLARRLPEIELLSPDRVAEAMLVLIEDETRSGEALVLSAPSS